MVPRPCHRADPAQRLRRGGHRLHHPGPGRERALGLPFGEPIVFQDKVFWNPATIPDLPTLCFRRPAGDLWYPWLYDPTIWPVAKGGIPPLPSAIPEFFGDTMLANGVVYPFHKVDRRHRFRLLNACNARWLDLSFVQENGDGRTALSEGPRSQCRFRRTWMSGRSGRKGDSCRRPCSYRRGRAASAVPPRARGTRRHDRDLQGPPGTIILYNVAGVAVPRRRADLRLVRREQHAGPTDSRVWPEHPHDNAFAVSGRRPTTAIPAPLTIRRTTIPTIPDPVRRARGRYGGSAPLRSRRFTL